MSKEKTHRTRKEIDAEYTRHSVMVGHLTRLLVETETALEKSIEDYRVKINTEMDALLALADEGRKLPPEPASEAPTPGNAA